MKATVLGSLTLIVGLLLVSTPAFAHHGGSSLYDLGKVTTVKATVTQFIWSNPHCELNFDAADDSGKVRHWTIEAHPPNILGTHGWTRKAMNPGDVVNITFHPGLNGTPIGILIKVVLPDGRELWQDVPKAPTAGTQ